MEFNVGEERAKRRGWDAESHGVALYSGSYIWWWEVEMSGWGWVVGWIFYG